MPCFAHPEGKVAIGAIVGGVSSSSPPSGSCSSRLNGRRLSELQTQLATSQTELSQRRQALARPSAAVTIKPSDLYRLTKALPNDTSMSGILLDVNRLAGGNDLDFRSITPSSPVLGTGYVQQPLAVIVQGRFSDVSQLPR